MATKAAETAALEAEISKAEADRLSAMTQRRNTLKSSHSLHPKWSRSDELEFHARAITHDGERKAFITILPRE